MSYRHAKQFATHQLVSIGQLLLDTICLLSSVYTFILSATHLTSEALQGGGDGEGDMVKEGW